jgi:hypothetical protein
MLSDVALRCGAECSTWRIRCHVFVHLKMDVSARSCRRRRLVNAIVIEHVPVAELPKAWREQLGQAADAHVTVRIEAEGVAPAQGAAAQFADDPLFGMWRDRDDMADVEAYIRRIRAPRFKADGSRNES